MRNRFRKGKPYVGDAERTSVISGRTDRWKAGIGLAAAVILPVLAVFSGAMGNIQAAAAGVSGEISSRGSIRCEQAVIDAMDLQDIRTYITEKKCAAVDTLVQLGTRFRNQGGTIVTDRNPDASTEAIDASQLGWPIIIQAVEDSQKVPAGLQVLHPEAALHIEGVQEYTDYYVTATEDNISRGKAAWADGRLLLGNGADNDKAYQAGKRDGGSGHVPEFVNPVFTVQESSAEIRHVHLGSPEKKDGISGCYENISDTQVTTKKCGLELVKTEISWIPNPEEPEGGSWHGGHYTCPYHSGFYDGPGVCTTKKTTTTVTWKHNVICGLEDAVYGWLVIRGTDTDYADRAITLEASLEQGDAYEQLVWTEGEQLTWTDAEGNILGTGPQLTVQTPGNYSCRINVSNEDIDNREVSVSVRISGLVLKN